MEQLEGKKTLSAGPVSSPVATTVDLDLLLLGEPQTKSGENFISNLMDFPAVMEATKK
jgi:hypothetical protein